MTVSSVLLTDLAGFDFAPAKVDRRQITGFATTAFTEAAEDIVPGVGKTPARLSAGLPHEIDRRLPRFFQELALARAGSDPKRRFRFLDRLPERRLALARGDILETRPSKSVSN